MERIKLGFKWFEHAVDEVFPLGIDVLLRIGDIEDLGDLTNLVVMLFTSNLVLID